MEKVLKVMTFRMFSGHFQGFFQGFSGYFQGIFRCFQRVFRVFFLMPFPGMPFGPFQKSEGYLNRSFRESKRGDKGGGEEGRSGGRVRWASRGERRKSEGKSVGGKGPESALENSLILVPI